MFLPGILVHTVSDGIKGLVGFFFSLALSAKMNFRESVLPRLLVPLKKKGEKIVVTGLSIKPRSSHSSFVGAASLFHSHLSFFVKSIRLAFSSFIFPPSLVPSNEYLLSLPLSKRRRKKKQTHKHTRAHTQNTCF